MQSVRIIISRTCSGLGLGDAGAIVLAYLLRGSLPQTVTHVHVRDNRIGACTHPPHPPLPDPPSVLERPSLLISLAPMARAGGAGAQALVRVLATSSAVHHLDLSGNGLGAAVSLTVPARASTRLRVVGAGPTPTACRRGRPATPPRPRRYTAGPSRGGTDEGAPRKVHGLMQAMAVGGGR